MNLQRVLLIVPTGEAECQDSRALEQTVRDSGFKVAVCDTASAPDYLKKSSANGEEPAVLLLGPDLDNALVTARQLRAVWPLGQMLFIPGPSGLQQLQRDLRHAPMIGSDWSLVELDDPALPRLISKAGQSSQRRKQLRTTLDRINLTVSQPRPADSLEYRRMVLSEHYLASLLAHSPEAILTLDTHNCILYWSTGAEKLFRQRAGAMYGTHVEELPFWTPLLDQSLQQIQAGTGSISVETQFTDARESIDLEVFISGVHDNSGRFIGASVVLRDISQRNRVLEAERRARQEAEHISRMKDEFMAVLSHELRTPLSAVIGRAQLLQMQYQDQPKLLASLSVIERNAQMQAKLIEDLLDTTSIITGKLKLDVQEIAVNQLVQAAAESIRPTAQNKSVTLHEDHAMPSPRVQGDSNRLQQVIFNLLSNAVKFTPEGGRIQISTRQEGPRVTITVTDNGLGISADFLPLVFNRFGQEDSSNSRRHGGLGLGLSIARQLVELHGGNIQVSSPGRNLGATFSVTLPLHKTSAPGTQKRRAEPAAAPHTHNLLQGVRILVVEDVADARELVLEVLSQYGAEVITAVSGEVALQKLPGFAPQVLVSDIGMPDMDGYELLKQVRARGFDANSLPALALSAFASPLDRSRALQAGFQNHVAKPLIVTELVSAIAQLLQLSPSQAP